MVLAAKLAHTRGDLSQTEVDRIVTLLKLYNLPTELPSEMTAEQFLMHMRKDKKIKKALFALFYLLNLVNAHW
eukprot:UN00768